MDFTHFKARVYPQKRGGVSKGPLRSQRDLEPPISDLGRDLKEARERALKRGSSEQDPLKPLVFGYVGISHPNIAKTAQHHRSFAKLPIFGIAFNQFLRKIFLKN